MNAENFPDFLLDNSKLWQLSYQELKTLALQYPYCANIALLLLKKSRLEELPEAEDNLHKAAALLPDRNFLRQQLQQLDEELLQEEKLLGEGVLELMDLDSLKETLPRQREGEEELIEAFAKRETYEIEENPITEQSDDFSEAFAKQGQVAEGKEEKPKTEEEQLPELKPETADATSPPDEPLPTPLNKTFEPVYQKPQLDAILRKQKRLFAQKPAPTSSRGDWTALDEPRRLATESVQKKEQVASETLARLYARQGYIKKALEMYEQLRLLNPQKSAYFAAQMKTLKKKHRK